MEDTKDRLDLVAHVRQKIAAGHYRNPAVLRCTLGRMAARGALGGLPSRTRAQLLAERQQASTQGDTAGVAEIDRLLGEGHTL